MTYQAKILADSVSPAGIRLTTFELTYPRIIHAEFMTHRVFSRNAASSRAIPVDKTIQRVLQDPFVPGYWGANQPGMQAEKEIPLWKRSHATAEWLKARDAAVAHARQLLALGVHKQLVNRLLEPFQWYTVICTATEWTNFFGLRDHPDAQPEIQVLARLMKQAYDAGTPTPLGFGEWHLPITPDLYDLQVGGYNLEDIKRISAGRCARVSYLTHHGERNPQADIDLCNEKIITPGHMSPLEHIATPYPNPEAFIGNFRGWKSFRKEIPHEADFSRRPKVEVNP